MSTHNNDHAKSATINSQKQTETCVLSGENKYITQWRKKYGRLLSINDKAENLTGLALSGGGIRSATFSLGVLQALAKQNHLHKIDYLSTVSGGGYIGSALTWLTSKKANKKRSDCHETTSQFDVSDTGFPFGHDDPNEHDLLNKNNSDWPALNDSKAQKSMLQFLRQHGNYLTPGSGIGMMSLIGVILRGILLNLMVWMPIFVLINLACLHLADIFKGWLPQVLLPKLMNDFDPTNVLHGYELLLWLAIGLTILTLLGLIIYSLLTRFYSGKKKKFRYALRQNSEKAAAIVIPTIIIMMLVGFIPVIDNQINTYLYETSTGAMLIGTALAIFNFIRSLGNDSKTSTDKFLPIIALLLIYSTTLATYHITWFTFWPMYDNSVDQTSQIMYFAWVLSMIVFSSVLGYFVNVNYISVHRFYRDRLMETFMPDIDTALNNITGKAKDADKAFLGSLNLLDSPTSPYHIINTNVVLVSSEKIKYKRRGGDNFILSSQYCGSDATGWTPTRNFMDGKMTWATAMAISGAAANPNAGVGGQGVTRNKTLSLVMSFLNVRLGYWAKNPKSKRKCHTPNHFFPGLYEFLTIFNFKSFEENRDFVQLSDGGHFENTAIYELIRRKCHLIIACDGGADANFTFSDFKTMARRVEEDFNTRIRVNKQFNQTDLLPSQDESTFSNGSQSNSKRGFMVFDVRYADKTNGTIIYLKTTLTNDVSYRIKSYAAQNPDFPDQSTADQFFDEAQVDAYRELGYHIASSMLKEKALVKLIQ